MDLGFFHIPEALCVFLKHLPLTVCNNLKSIWYCCCPSDILFCKDFSQHKSLLELCNQMYQKFYSAITSNAEKLSHNAEQWRKEGCWSLVHSGAQMLLGTTFTLNLRTINCSLRYQLLVLFKNYLNVLRNALQTHYPFRKV